MRLKIASDDRELQRLRNQVNELEGQSTHAIESQLRVARRALEVQQRIQAGIEKISESIVRQLQRARDENATDMIARRRAENQARQLLTRADTKVAAARAEQAVAEERARAADSAAHQASRELREAREALKRKHCEWLALQEADAIAQAEAGQCNSHLEFLAGCVMKTVAPGESKRFKQPNRTHRGPGIDGSRGIRIRKGFADLAHSQRNVRSHALSEVMKTQAGGEDPTLYPPHPISSYHTLP